MRSKLSSTLAAVTLLAGVAAAQTSTDMIYYPFLTGSGTSVKNLAAGGPATGTIMSTATSQWATGKTNSALAGASNQSPTTYNYVDTGWKPTLKDDFTFAFFMKEANDPGSALSYVMSGIGSFRTFTNGVAGSGLYCRAWGGTPADLVLKTDIKTPSKTAWTHIALVVDWTGSKTAVWYINGKPDTVIPITAGANLVATVNLRVGLHTSTSSSWTYDTDEFRFSNRAASPGEIAAWANMTPAGDGVYNAANCAATLSGVNGPPTLGNSKYGLAIAGNATSPFLASIGFKRGLFVLDLGLLFPPMKGCVFDSSLDIIIVGATDGKGNGAIPLPIPKDKNLLGADLWNQAIILINEQGTNGLNMWLNA